MDFIEKRFLHIVSALIKYYIIIAPWYLKFNLKNFSDNNSVNDNEVFQKHPFHRSVYLAMDCIYSTSLKSLINIAIHHSFSLQKLWHNCEEFLVIRRCQIFSISSKVVMQPISSDCSRGGFLAEVSHMESRLLEGQAAINFSQVLSVSWHIISKLFFWRLNKHIKATVGTGFKMLPNAIGSTASA